MVGTEAIVPGKELNLKVQEQGKPSSLCLIAVRACLKLSKEAVIQPWSPLVELRDDVAYSVPPLFLEAAQVAGHRR